MTRDVSDYVRAVVDMAPPLSERQKDQIAYLLRPAMHAQAQARARDAASEAHRHDLADAEGLDTQPVRVATDPYRLRED